MLLIGNGFLGKNINSVNVKNRNLSQVISLRELNNKNDENLFNTFYGMGHDLIVLILGAGQERSYNPLMLKASISLLNGLKNNSSIDIKKFKLRLITSGGTIYGYSNASPVKEETILPEINSEYGLAARNIEKLFFEYFPSSEYDSISLRVGNVVSPLFRNNSYGMVDKLVLCAKSDTTFNLFVPIETRRDFISIDFLVDALMLVKRENTFGGKLNIAPLENHCLKDVIEIVLQRFPNLKINFSASQNIYNHDYNMNSELLFKTPKLKSEKLEEIVQQLL
jgi:hypothetical protein